MTDSAATRTGKICWFLHGNLESRITTHEFTDIHGNVRAPTLDVVIKKLLKRRLQGHCDDRVRLMGNDILFDGATDGDH